jgi:hypothetical protein
MTEALATAMEAGVLITGIIALVVIVWLLSAGKKE